ncbi:MAG: hypothetical protein K0S47_588 [Herbinix sp.]|jgi:hypothetical protein|nr:hypothetical protein [Herbinix sp.]
MENNYSTNNEALAREEFCERKVTDGNMADEPTAKEVKIGGSNEAEKNEIVTPNMNNLTFEEKIEKFKDLLSEEYAKKVNRHLPTILANSEFPGGQINNVKDFMDAIDELELDEEIQQKLHEEVPETKVDLTDGLMKIYNWDNKKAGIYAGITVESKSKRSKLYLVLKHEDGVCCDPFEFRMSDFSSNNFAGSKVLKGLTEFQGNNHIDCDKLYHAIWDKITSLPRVTYKTIDDKPDIGEVYRSLILEAKKLYAAGNEDSIKRDFYFFLPDQFDEVARLNGYKREELLRQLALSWLLVCDDDGRLGKTARVKVKEQVKDKKQTELKKGYAVISLERFLARTSNDPIINEKSLQELEDRYFIMQYDRHKKKGVLFSFDQEIKYIEAIRREEDRVNKAKRKVAETEDLIDDNIIIDSTYREIESDTYTFSLEEAKIVTAVTSRNSSLEMDKDIISTYINGDLR